MILEVKQFPESQSVMDNAEWFFIMDGNPDTGNRLGDSAYARVLHEDEYKCPKCESIHPVHTINNLSDGSWHEVKDGSTTIIPDPFLVVSIPFKKDE